MNSSRRWLVGFAISIGAVAVIAVALVLLTQGKNVTLLAADTPRERCSVICLPCRIMTIGRPTPTSPKTRRE